jgi:ornithine cyclodeaminase
LGILVAAAQAWMDFSSGPWINLRAMAILVIDAEQVRRLLPMSECIDVMAEALKAVSGGAVVQPQRTVLPVDNEGSHLFVMPAASGPLACYGAKLISLTPANAGKRLPTIRGDYLLFETETGSAVALVDALSLTAIRTAAASGLAARLLARPEATTCGIFGTGVQARTHVEAMCAVRPLREIRIWGRDWEKTNGFARQLKEITGLVVSGHKDPATVAACDIICTVTSATQPILRGEWVRPGAHVNLVGAHMLTQREADTELVRRSRVFVDQLEAARREAGDLMIPIQEASVPADHIRGEIGKVAAGALAGRTSPDEVTLFKSVGIAAEDLFAARHVFNKARATP